MAGSSKSNFIKVGLTPLIIEALDAIAAWAAAKGNVPTREEAIRALLISRLQTDEWLSADHEAGPKLVLFREQARARGS